MSLSQGNQGATGKVLGQNIIAGMGEFSDQLFTELMARYYENAYRGNAFYAVNIAAQALSVASATYTGLVVQNPPGSGINLVLKEAIWVNSIAVTGIGAIVLGWGGTQAAGVPTALTTGNSSGPSGLSAQIGANKKSGALVGASCTWAVNGASGAPTILRPLVGVHWVTAGTTTSFMQYKDEIAGGLIVPPGIQVGFEAIGTALTGFGFLSWDEIPQ